MNTSNNHDNTHVRGGASTEKTAANTVTDPDSSTSTGVLGGLFSGSKGDQNAPAAPASKGIFGIDTRTCVDGGQPDNGQGSIKATLGKVKHEIMGTNPGDNMGKE